MLASMTFREKSAWATGALMLAAGLYYLKLALPVLSDPASAGEPAIAASGALIPYTIAVVIGSVVIQAALAILSPRDATRPADEREAIAIARAGNWSGIVLAFGAVAGALYFLTHGDGTLLFHWVIGSLIVAQIANYGFQIVLFRRGY